MYNKLLPTFKSHVQKNSGTEQDAKDLFQEALIVLYRKVYDPAFHLSSTVETFIFAVGKKKWLYELRKRKKNVSIMEAIDESNNYDINEILHEKEKIELYLKHFKNLTEGCGNILTLAFKGMKMKNIANELNFGSEGYARKRKHECQEKLINLIKEDPLFGELGNE